MTFYKQPPEIEEGNREYKYKISRFSSNKIESLSSQMKFRLYEGNGKALYIIGVHDDGTPTGIDKKELDISIKHLKKVANNLDAKVQSIKYYSGREGFIATIRITRELEKIENEDGVLFIL